MIPELQSVAASNKQSSDKLRFEALLESAQLLHASLDLDDLLRHLLRTVMGRLSVGRALIAVEENDVLQVKLARGVTAFKAGDTFEVEKAKTAKLDALFYIGNEDRPVGVLAVGKPLRGAIDESEKQSLNALLGIAASGIANARAHAETKLVNQSLDQKVQELRALLDLVRGLTSTLEPEGVANLLMLTLAGRWAIRRYALTAWKDNHAPVTRARGIKLFDASRLKQVVCELNESTRVEDLPEGELKHDLQEQGVCIVFPICAGDETSGGIVALGARSSGALYSDADLEFGAGLVAQAGVAFENSWFVRETIERKKIEQELELAADIQSKLFPESLPTLAGFDIAARNRPARHCGGDYYDALPLDETDGNNDEKTGNQGAHLLCVADVSGKGLPASLLMSNMQASLRALLHATPTLADLAARINDLLYRTTPANKYVTAILARFDPATGELTYVNAGHNGGLLLRSDGTHSFFQPTGTPIGMFPGLPYTETTLSLQSGDTLALFSDGFPEAQNEAMDEYGEERLEKFLQTVKDKSSTEIVDAAFDDIDRFAGLAPQFDDITLMVIKAS